jgi:hypothetical protein
VFQEDQMDVHKNAPLTLKGREATIYLSLGLHSSDNLRTHLLEYLAFGIPHLTLLKHVDHHSP